MRFWILVWGLLTAIRTIRGIDLRFAPMPEETEEIALVKWKQMEKGLRDSMEKIVNDFVMPQLTSQPDFNVSGKCMSDMFKFLKAISRFELWAFKMIDAIGKPSGGQMEGTASAFGDFEECLNVVFPKPARSKLPATVGRYCTIDLRVPLPPKPDVVYYKTEVFRNPNATFDLEIMRELKNNAYLMYNSGFMFGVCIPSSCSHEDLQSVIDTATSSMAMSSKVHYCETKQPFTLDKLQMIILSIMASFVAVVLMSGVLDWYLESKVKPDEKPVSAGTIQSLIRAFSLQRNWSKLFNCELREGDILSNINGMRVITMSWVMLGHSYIAFDWRAMSHMSALEEIQRDIPAQAIINGYMAVQSFLVLTGVLVAYNCITYYDKTKNFNIPVLIIRRILRLLPVMVLAVGVIIVISSFGSGPLWVENQVTGQSRFCRINWWHTLLFIQNFYSFEDACLPHTWFPTLGKLLLFLLVIGSSIAAALTMYYTHFPPTFLAIFADLRVGLDMMRYYYIAPYIQVGVYAVGLALGTFIARSMKPEKLSLVPLLFGWAIAATLGLGVVYGGHYWNKGQIPTDMERIIYGAIYRPAWAISISWVIYVCAKGQGGIINSILSWKFLQPLSRLCYLIYIMHLIITMAYGASRKGSMEVSHAIIIWLYFGHLCISTMACVGFRLFYESPIIELEKLGFKTLSSRGEKKLKPADCATSKL